MTKKLKVHIKQKYKHFFIVLAFAVILSSMVFFVFEKASLTGYIILPTDVKDYQIVIDYLEQTRNYRIFEILVMDPENIKVERYYLCSTETMYTKPCLDLEILQKIDNYNWPQTYYWYVKFSSEQWMEKPLYLEFIIRGNDGVIMQADIGETPRAFR